MLTRPFFAFSLLLLACLLATNSWATYLTWADYPNGRLYRIDTEKKILEQEINTENWQRVAPINFTGINPIDFPLKTRVISIEIPSKKWERYLLIDCTNQVYHFDFKNLTLTRIDRTFFRGYNCLSTRFMRKDTLYSFGGYGFWQTNNIQTYFQSNTHEWESILPINIPPKAINHGLNAYLSNSDLFFSAYNSFHIDSKNSGKSEYDRDAFMYSFQTKKWKNLGAVSNQKVIEVLTQKDKTPIIWTGEYFLLEYKEDAVIKFLLIDPVNNLVSIWQDSQKVFGSQIAKTIEEDPFALYCWHNTLYFVNDTEVTKPSLRHNIAIATIIKEAIPDGNLYNPYRHWYWALGFALGIILIVFLIMRFNRKVFNHPIDTTQPEILTTFSEIEIKVLDVLKEHFEGVGVDSNQINELLQISDKLPDNQRKIRNDFMKALNQKLTIVYQVEEAIIKKPSVHDKRYYFYQLSKIVFDKM
ncbi:hypothetical protein VB776_18315 [Arcicella sp. DC2W]|uniref:DUF4350 domain-containing protein n=1 Tax=Arcicella gelida TaxID=2984195 RepID=A0ABU5S8V5_9BACT|nr:hypothetical protein [Arcicella sp. DC2W]MEA5404896.1 hypothetical protein [Arcicella sp. DC2W]